ncbi:MAG: hypothetical protein H6754_06835 [Candidatus Omnitrophica bacterium]|nr:hypothetical protein [Candidatus Omnitrophota bacterium]
MKIILTGFVILGLLCDVAFADELTANVRKADAYFQNRQYELAIIGYQQVFSTMSTQPISPECFEAAEFGLARSYLRVNSRQEARKRLESYLDRYPNGKYVSEVKEDLKKLVLDEIVLALKDKLENGKFEEVSAECQFLLSLDAGLVAIKKLQDNAVHLSVIAGKRDYDRPELAKEYFRKEYLRKIFQN